MFDLLEKDLILGLITLIVIIPLYYKMGLLNWLTGKKNGNGKINHVKEKLEEIEENHLAHVQQGIDKLDNKTEILIRGQDKIISILEEVKTYGVKLRE